MKSEEEIKGNWARLDKRNFAEIEAVLQRFKFDEQVMLASFIASICDVDYADLFTEVKRQENTHARWLYWYALRYMTSDTYEKISARTYFDGCRFGGQTVGVGISKMARMISTEPKWNKCWKLVKHMIDLHVDPHSYHQNDFTNPLPQKYKVSLRVPRELKDKIEVEIKTDK